MRATVRRGYQVLCWRCCRVPNRADVWLVFFASLAVRAAALAVFSPDASGLYYWEASGVLRSGGPRALSDAVGTSLEPFYPFVLALLRTATADRLVPAMLAQAAIASAAAVVLYRLTQRLAGRRAALVAAGLYALDPYLIRQSVSPIEVTVLVALLIGAVTLFTRAADSRYAAAAGVLLGLATLTRFSAAPVAAVGVAILGWRRQWAQAASCLVAAALPVAGWMFQTSAENGAIVPTRVGINLFVSTNQYAGAIVPTRNSDLLVPWAYDTVRGELNPSLPYPLLQRLEDEALLRKAFEFAQAHPLETAQLKLRNLAYTFVPILLPFDRTPRSAKAEVVDGRLSIPDSVPRPLIDHVLYSGSRVVLLVGFSVGLWRRRGQWSEADAVMVAIVITIVGVHTVFFPTSRLLAPMAFVTMFYSGAAVKQP